MSTTSSGSEPDPEKANVNFDQYPSWKYQNHVFSSFNTLYDKIKSELSSGSSSSSKITIPDLSSVKGPILGKSISKTGDLYNKLINSLQQYIRYMNNSLSYVGNKKRTGTQIGIKGNPILVEKFKNIRKYQPECNVETYIIPGFFTKTKLEPITDKNSVTINKKIIRELTVCFSYLKSIMKQTFKNSIGVLNYETYESKIDSILNTEFKINNREYSSSSSSSSWYRGRGGSKKKVKFNLRSKKYKKLTIKKI